MLSSNHFRTVESPPARRVGAHRPPRRTHGREFAWVRSEPSSGVDDGGSTGRGDCGRKGGLSSSLGESNCLGSPEQRFRPPSESIEICVLKFTVHTYNYSLPSCGCNCFPSALFCASVPRWLSSTPPSQRVWQRMWRSPIYAPWLAWKAFVIERCIPKSQHACCRLRSQRSADHVRAQGTLPEDLGNLGSKLILEEIK